MILVDTNVIVRYFIGEADAQYEEAKVFFEKVENRLLQCRIEQMVIGEVLFVMQRYYAIEKTVIAGLMSELLSFDAIFCDDKEVMLAAIDIYSKQSIDFADAILCAKANLRGFEVFSFDRDIKKCTKKRSH